MSKFGPTPPGLIPVGATDMPVPIGTHGVLQTVAPSLLEVVTFDDAAPHDIASYDVPEDRCVTVVSFVSAFDSAGNQVAFAVDVMAWVRFGTGPLNIFGGINLNFVPFAPPWNTITAVATPILNTFVLRVTGLAATPIRWSAALHLFGGIVR